MPRETEKHSLMMIGGKQIGGPRPGGRHQDGHGMTKSEDFFFWLQISHPHSGNCSVCDGSVHTLRVARTFSLHFFLAWRTDTNTHGTMCLQCACHISPSHTLCSFVWSAVLAVAARLLRVSHVSHGELALLREIQESTPRETVARQRERGKRRFCDQCCRVDVKEKSTEQY